MHWVYVLRSREVPELPINIGRCSWSERNGVALGSDIEPQKLSEIEPGTQERSQINIHNGIPRRKRSIPQGKEQYQMMNGYFRFYQNFEVIVIKLIIKVL